MLLRKINSVLSLLCTVLLLDHAIFLGAWMITKGGIEKSAGFLPWFLVGAMVMHAFISINLAISAHSEEKKESVKSYNKENIITLVQRISGIALLALTALHVAGATGVMTPPQVIHAIVPPLFYAVALAHTAVSTSKALITLGVGNAKVVKVIDIAVKAICAVTLVIDIVGFYLYVV